MSRKRTTVLLALLVLVAGCSAGGGGGLGQSEAEAPGGAPAGSGGGSMSVERDAAGGSGGDAGSGDDPVAQVRNRQLIQTAEVELRVESYARTRSRLTEAARQRDGFVSNANDRLRVAPGGNYTTGTVTYRVPADEFEAFLETVNDTGTVVSSRRTTEDVTDQLVDIEARLETLRTQRDRLRGLYANASDTEEILQVERRLTEVQTEIERLEARQASLERQVALSTVTVEIREPEPGAPPEGAWYDTPLVEAFLSSVGGVVVTLRALAVAGAYVAPYVLVFVGPPVAGVVLAWRRWGPRRSSGGGSGRDGPPAGDGTETEREDSPADEESS